MDANSINPTSNQPKAPRDWALVVDDDEGVRQFLTEQLLSMQLQVLAADRGETALQLLEVKSTPPLLVVIDVMMPGIDGLTLARRLLSRCGPRTKIVIVSGHLAGTSWWPVDLREVSFLPKPFRLADLERLVAVARILRGPPQ